MIEAKFQEWFDHWFATADAWKEELRAEGLTDTVVTLQEHIDWQRKHVRPQTIKNQPKTTGEPS